MATGLPALVYVEVPPVTEPVASSSLLPFLQLPWPGECTESVMMVVCPLDFQVTVPPEISDVAAPEADVFAFCCGAQRPMVTVPVAVPLSELHEMPEAASAGVDVMARPANVAKTVRASEVVATVAIRRMISFAVRGAGALPAGAFFTRLAPLSRTV